jgi:hypothetical protein
METENQDTALENDQEETQNVPEEMQELTASLKEGLQGFVTFCRDQGKKAGYSVELAVKFSIDKLNNQ